MGLDTAQPLSRWERATEQPGATGGQTRKGMTKRAGGRTLRQKQESLSSGFSTLLQCQEYLTLISEVFKASAHITAFLDHPPPSFYRWGNEALRTQVTDAQCPDLHTFPKSQPDRVYQATAQRRSLRLRGLGTRVAGAQGGSSKRGED